MKVNRYAAQIMKSGDITPKSSLSCWKDINVADLKTFIGLVYRTGKTRMSRIQDYWKTDNLF